MNTFSWNSTKRDRREVGHSLGRFKKKAVASLAILGIAALSSLGNTYAADPIAVSTGLGVKATLYGFAEFDGIYTDNRTAANNYTLYALDQSVVPKNDSETRLTASATRLGLNFSGPEGASAQAAGKVEVDFFGSGTEVAAGFRLRQAYASVAFPDKGFTLLAGQTWDVVAPLNPPTLDAGILFYSGNLGARRPQLRLTESQVIEGAKFELAAAALRDVGVQGPSASQVDTGRSANAPAGQARLGVAIPVGLGKQTLNLGIGGLYGINQVFAATGDTSINLDSKAIAADLEAPFADQASVAGEIYQGANLGNYSGTIGENVLANATLSKYSTYKGWGGWAALRLKPSAVWLANLGFGVDQVTNKTGLPTTAQTRNDTVFANVAYLVTPVTKIGLEYGHTETTYAHTDGKSSLNRGQLSVVYSF